MGAGAEACPFLSLFLSSNHRACSQARLSSCSSPEARPGSRQRLETAAEIQPTDIHAAKDAVCIMQDQEPSDGLLAGHELVTELMW